MATPSLTSAGLWSEYYKCDSSQTLNLKIGILTRIDVGRLVNVSLNGTSVSISEGYEVNVSYNTTSVSGGYVAQGTYSTHLLIRLS